MGITDDKLSEKFEVTTIPEVVVEVETLANNDSDIEKARSTYRGLIDDGETAIKDILHIAANTESPRAYEVAGQLIKAVSEVAKDLVAAQKGREKAAASTDIDKQTNIFVGSTKELLHLLKHPGDAEVTDTDG